MHRLLVLAPLFEVQPIVALALLQAEGTWEQRALAHSAAWEWVEEGGYTIRLAPGTHRQTSLLTLRPALNLPDPSHALPDQLVGMLRGNDFEVIAERTGPSARSLPSPPTPSPAPIQEETPLPLPLSEEERHARRNIYRTTAQDQRAPLEQRFHAARVLAEAGDVGVAARVLGALAFARRGTVSDDALQLLGTLGGAAHPILWQLDARTSEASRVVSIARELLRAGDVATALLRLERLAQHADVAVQEAALTALDEAGPLGRPTLETLAQGGNPAPVRLRAARRLLAHGAASTTLRAALVGIAEGEGPEHAQVAVSLLARLTEPEADMALLSLARRAPIISTRLAAAEALHERGRPEEARAVLLELAVGEAGGAVGALDLLATVSGPDTADTEQVMGAAALRSVRRRAAVLLGQAHQPLSVQEAAARVLLALERPDLARPILARLAVSEGVERQRWAAQGLAAQAGSALEEMRRAFRHSADPVAGQFLVEGLLGISRDPEDRRQAARWLAEHSNLPRAIEVLTELANSARVSGSEAVRATHDLERYARRWAGAARALAALVSDSPHPAVRARALDLLLRDFPAELPLALLVDLAVTGSIGAADRAPVMEQLAVLARPAAARIATRLTDDATHTERRWHLLQLLNELPERAATPALLHLSARAPQNRIRYVASEQLIARGQRRAGFAALATIAINEPDATLREMALYELAQGLPDTETLLQSIGARARYSETQQLARALLHQHLYSPRARVNRWLDAFLARWEGWVASLPLEWLDRLVGPPRDREGD